MAICAKCGQNVWRMDMVGGLCSDCNSITRSEANEAQQRFLEEQEAAETARRQAVGGILLTTETAPALPITERLDIVTAECVYGMHIFKDLFAAGRDIVGGRSEALQTTLRDARQTVLYELRVEAHRIGADAVVAVDLDYSEISGGGKSMLLLVASGTAVRLGTC